MLVNAQVRRVAILGGNRIPFARSNTAYATASNQQMLTAALQGLVDRFNLHGQRLDEVVAGAVIKLSRDFNLTRESVLSTTLAKQTPAYDVQQACGTGLEAAILVANKIALGHHRDDIVNTFFLNMFFGGKMKAMPPKLATDNGDHIVIRPLAYCAEKDIASYARAMEFPIIPCNLCGSQENLQRKKVKEMLLEWERQHPGRTDKIFASLQNVVPSHLADTELFDFNGLSTGLAKIGEDSLFGQTSYDQAPLVFAGSHDDRIEFVRFERNSERKPADTAAADEAAAN